MRRSETKDFLLELDGPGVHASTVDSVKLLALASAYFDLLLRMAVDDEMPMTFHGLEIVEKCVSIKVQTEQADYAQQLAGMSAPYVSGVQSPRGLGQHVGRVQDALRAFPRDCKAKVIVGPWTQDLFVPETLPPADFPTAIETMRANIQRIGGTDPKVRFKGLFEKYTFSIDITEAQAVALAPHLYEDVDITIRVIRTGEGRVSFCELQGFEPVSEMDSSEAWRSWFKPYAEHWDKVKDIPEVLGRRDRS